MAFKSDSKIPPDAHLLIIGAMKCGTTSLYRFLVQHPQICGAVTKEPEFFSESQGHKKRFESYEDLWDFDAAIFRYTLEASTGYTKYPKEANVARRIYDHGLTPKFIYIVRNPFDRIQSHFNFMHSKRDPEWSLGVTDDHLIMVSNYFLQLEQYRTFFPSRSFLVLDLDELRLNPGVVRRKLCDFLDLSDAHFPASFPVKNRTQHPSSLEIKLLSTFDPLLRRLPPGFWSRSKAKAVRRLLLKVSQPDTRFLTDDERALIHDRLRDDMRHLHDAHGVDVNKWGFEA